MKIITKEAGRPHETRTFETFGLEEMQAIVDGYIEPIYVGHGVDMWLNDSGKLYNLPLNLVLGSDGEERKILDTIQGDIFFAGSDDEGGTVGLTDEQIEWVEQNLDSGDFALSYTDEGIEFIPVWVYAPDFS